MVLLPKITGHGGGGLGLNKILMIAGLVVGVMVILGIGLTLINNVAKGPQDEFLALAARTANLQTLVDKQKLNIKNADLRKINTDASVLLLSDSVELATQAKTLFGVAEIPEAVSTAESLAALEDTLEKAKVSGTFDHTYVTELQDKLTATYDLAKKMRDAVGDADAKAALDKTMNDLTATYDQLATIQL